MNDLLALQHNTAHDLGRIHRNASLIEKRLVEIDNIELKNYIQQKLNIIIQSNEY